MGHQVSSIPEPNLKLSFSESIRSVSAIQNERSQANNLIVFDWDDTLFPTKKVCQMNKLPEFDDRRIQYEQELNELSHLIYKVLSEYIHRYKAGNIRIVSSSEKGWIQKSLIMLAHIGCFESIYHLIMDHHIPLIHPLRSCLPWTTRKKVLIWKAKVFRSLLNDCYSCDMSSSDHTLNSFVCIGDSVYEFKASKLAAKAFDNLFVHRIKFMKSPSMNDMMDQMNLLLKFCEMFDEWMQTSSEAEKTNMTIVHGSDCE
eukprot:109698_1